MSDHRTAVIGLGGMGLQMLARMARHPGFEVVAAWDPDAAARDETAARYPGLQLAGSLGEAVGSPETSVVYIAAPPIAHLSAARAALDAGKAVYCEKPLGVDVGESTDLVERAQQSRLVNIVNFSLATTAATTEVETWLADGRVGTVVGIDIRVHFSQWPRRWQMGAAGWLGHRAEGGFTREVLSHWIYLTERLFGSTTLEDAWARYPGGDLAETHVAASLSAQGVPVSAAGSIGGVGPDLVEYTIWGSLASARISDWRHFSVNNGDGWEPRPAKGVATSDLDNASQLANAAAAVAGETHSMPSFADALSVQVLVEQMLARLI